MLFNPTTRTRRAAATVLAVGLVGGAGGATAIAASNDPPQPANLRFSNPTRITNPWLPLSTKPLGVMTGSADGKQARSVRTLLKRTEPFTVHGQRIRAAIVDDRVYLNGVLHEVALDYYAQADDGTVYYLGEDTAVYDKTGKHVVNHKGAFRYGRDTKVLGVAMPAHPRKGQRFASEEVPGVGSEHNRIAGTGEKLVVPAGTFNRTLRVTSRVQPDNENETVWYARGVGLLKEQGPGEAVSLVAKSHKG